MNDGPPLVQTPTPGAMFGRYKVLRKLGEGGMGVVYEAEHPGLGKRVALKTLRAHLAGDAATVGRFVREGQAAARIHHPNVVDVTDVGTAQGVPYLVMELLEGETLAARIQRGPVDPVALAGLMLPVCAAVAAAHAQGVLHRDLKPANVLLRRTPHGPVRPTVLDFGIAKICDEDASLSLTSSATVLGTPFYMSPEQARGARDVDARSDQYALGVILYECCTGKKPYEGASLLALAWEITSGTLRPPRDVLPGLPAGFEAVVLRAMDRDPAQRFGSVRELGAALLPFADARTRLLWEDAFRPTDAPPSSPARRVTGSAPHVAAVVDETVGGPRPLVGDRLPGPAAPPPRRARPWRSVIAVGVVLLGVAAYRVAPTSSPSPVAPPRIAASPDPPAAPAVVAADVVLADVVTTDSMDVTAATARESPVRPARVPVRGAPGARRLPPSEPGRREIPME